MKTAGHGGDIHRLAEELRIAEQDIIDFSASVNPIGLSSAVKTEIRRSLRELHHYPDSETRRLREALSRYHGIDPGMILCGNGSTELIYLIPRALRPRTVLIPAPTFSEYERAISLSRPEVDIRYLFLHRDTGFEIRVSEFISAMDGADMAFLCNPNNPTGRLLKKWETLRIAEAARRLRCLLIVDEAFIDFHPEDSVIMYVRHNPFLIVLRSMTKFYALTGLRIGYGVFPPHLIDRLKGFKEPWTVNTLAQKAAIAALLDEDYVTRTLRLIARERVFLEEGFRRLGIEFFPSDANFYLLRIRGGTDVYKRLREGGILVRDCSNFRGLDGSYIRVSVRARRENRILIRALREILDGKEVKTYV